MANFPPLLRGILLDQVITIRETIRALRGGSQPLVGRADRTDFVLKCPNNLQGPNVLSNEVIGGLLMAALGLPTSPWRFAAFHPSIRCPICDESATRFRSQPLLHFASKLLTSPSGGEARDAISPFRFHRIENRSDFLEVLIFDIWAGSVDVRQAIFVEHGDSARYQAIFIDNGHLFGGPDWNLPMRRGIALARDCSIYRGIITPAAVSAIIAKMRRVIAATLPRALASLPMSWSSVGMFWLQEALMHRLERLPLLVQTEIDAIEVNLRTSQIGLSYSNDPKEKSCHPKVEAA